MNTYLIPGAAIFVCGLLAGCGPGGVEPGRATPAGYWEGMRAVRRACCR